MQRPTGVTILAVLAFIGAGLLVVGALFGLLGGMLVSTMSASRMGMIAGVGAAVLAVFLLIFAAVDVVVGVGLWKLKNWARILTIVLDRLAFLGSVLSILNPFGHMSYFLFCVSDQAAGARRDLRVDSLVSVPTQREAGLRRHWFLIHSPAQFAPRPRAWPVIRPCDRGVASALV